jgi:hypothetical protein
VISKVKVLLNATPWVVMIDVMEAITVEQIGKIFYARCTYEQKDIVKAAGFRWDGGARKWYTKDPAVAAKFADAGAAQQILKQIEERKEQRAATEGTSRAQIEKDAQAMTPEQIGSILAGLRQLAAMDQDHATALNGVGFSKADSFIGQRLAALSYLTPKQAALGAKLVHRYRRQIG